MKKKAIFSSRSCGYFDTDECAHDVDWEKGSAYGSICHCKTDNCNGAQTNGPMSLVLILGLSILAFFGVMK